MALVEFKNVEKYYGDYHALRDINLLCVRFYNTILHQKNGLVKSYLKKFTKIL